MEVAELGIVTFLRWIVENRHTAIVERESGSLHQLTGTLPSTCESFLNVNDVVLLERQH
jgi:hypothetical protein